MTLDELLGIDPTNPVDRLASRLVEADASLVDALRRRRVELGWSHADLGERMGISEGSARRLEVAQDLHQSTMRRWKLALGVAVEYVITPVPAATSTPGGRDQR